MSAKTIRPVPADVSAGSVSDSHETPGRTRSRASARLAAPDLMDLSTLHGLAVLSNGVIGRRHDLARHNDDLSDLPAKRLRAAGQAVAQPSVFEEVFVAPAAVQDEGLSVGAAPAVTVTDIGSVNPVEAPDVFEALITAVCAAELAPAAAPVEHAPEVVSVLRSPRAKRRSSTEAGISFDGNFPHGAHWTAPMTDHGGLPLPNPWPQADTHSLDHVYPVMPVHAHQAALWPLLANRQALHHASATHWSALKVFVACGTQSAETGDTLAQDWKAERAPASHLMAGLVFGPGIGKSLARTLSEVGWDKILVVIDCAYEPRGAAARHSATEKVRAQIEAFMGVSSLSQWEPFPPRKKFEGSQREKRRPLHDLFLEEARGAANAETDLPARDSMVHWHSQRADFFEKGTLVHVVQTKVISRADLGLASERWSEELQCKRSQLCSMDLKARAFVTPDMLALIRQLQRWKGTVPESAQSGRGGPVIGARGDGWDGCFSMELNTDGQVISFQELHPPS